VSHESYPVLCPGKDRRRKDRQSGNHPVGTVTRHDARCGCSAPDWKPNEPPESWFEYTPERTPWVPGHEPFFRIVRGDPSDPDATVDAFCKEHGRLRFTVGELVAGHAFHARRHRSR
jgi:hypothetical protein